MLIELSPSDSYNLNKRATPDDYKKGVALMKKHNIVTYASFIMSTLHQFAIQVWN